EDLLSKKINEVVKTKIGIGFEPTTRNVFAVVLASVDTWIRMMQDVHQKAIDVSQERASLITGHADKGEELYPWPQITKKGITDDKPVILVYPGDPSVSGLLHVYDDKFR